MEPIKTDKSAALERGRVQFITHRTDRHSYIDSARLALEGGCKWIQLRMKEASEDEILEAASDVRKLCDSFGAVFILDDHAELAGKAGADGVHLGLNDMPIDQARRLLGDGKIIGGTANMLEDIIMHYHRGADYIGCGPFRFTTTKKRLSPVLGIEGYKQMAKGMERLGIRIPVVAIGGITSEDIPDIMAAGVYGIAVSGTVLRAEDPTGEMRKIIKTIQNG